MRCFCIGCIEISQRFTIVIKKTKKEVGDIALSRWPPMLAKAKLARDSPSVLGLGVELIEQYGGEEQVRRTVIASFVPAALARCSI